MPKHDFYPSDYYDDDVDIFRLDVEGHNGPGCRRCGQLFCHHCYPEVYTEECPSGQMEFKV